MPVFVIFTGKALDVVVTGDDGALFRSLALVSQHVGLHVLEGPFAAWECASFWFPCIRTANIAIWAS